MKQKLLKTNFLYFQFSFSLCRFFYTLNLVFWLYFILLIKLSKKNLNWTLVKLRIQTLKITLTKTVACFCLTHPPLSLSLKTWFYSSLFDIYLSFSLVMCSCSLPLVLPALEFDCQMSDVLISVLEQWKDFNALGIYSRKSGQNHCRYCCWLAV